MNKGIVRYILGRLLLVEAGLMVLPLLVGLVYRESFRTIGSFLLGYKPLWRYWVC